MTRLSVPGNLLVAGEYAVTREGGLGVSIAVSPRAYAEHRLGGPTRVLARFSGREERWPASRPGPASPAPPTAPTPTPSGGAEGTLDAGAHGPKPPMTLVEAVWKTAARQGLVPDNPADTELGSFTVDTTPFFGADMKLGLGSSAAATVCLSALLLRALELYETALVAEIAVQAHRLLQGGRGSGYDVLTSLQGGLGLFTGGAQPERSRLDHRIWPPMGIRHGERSVSTPRAVEAFERWTNTAPTAANAYVETNNRIVRRLSTAAHRDDVVDGIREAKSLGRELGRTIGIAAEPEHPPESTTHCVEKPLGAGAETYLVVPYPDCSAGAGVGDNAEVIPLTIETEGLRWE